MAGRRGDIPDRGPDARLGDVDTYGDYPGAALAGFLVGATLFVGGLVPLGRWLRSEDVVLVGNPAPTR